MSFEDQLRDDLHAVPVPALRVPNRLADRALVGARRQTRLRAVAVAGVAAAAVASAVPALRGVLPGGEAATPGDPTCVTAGPLPARPPASAWEYFDPLRFEMDASGVPGYQVSSSTTSTYFQVLELTNPAEDRLVTITLYATDGVPHYRTAEAMPHPLDPATGELADPVNGAPAYWLPEQTFTGLPRGEGLAWQWSPGAWVFVHAAALDPDGPTVDADGDSDELRAIATEAATRLQFGVGAPVTAPFSLPVPDCTRLSYTTTMHGTTREGALFTRFGVTFTSGGEAESDNPLLLPGLTFTMVSVTADTAATPTDKPGSATSDVDGHPASLNGCDPVLQGCDSGIIYDVDGLALEITVSNDPGVGVVDVYRAVQVFPGADSDPSSWGDPIAP